MQVEAGESKLLPFETFPFFFFVSPTGVIEELALLKNIGLAGTFCIIWQEIPLCQVCDTNA